MFSTTLPIESLSATHALQTALLTGQDTPETLLLCAGAIAGHCTIHEVWETHIRLGEAPHEVGLHEVRTLNQVFFYFGSLLDETVMPDSFGTLWHTVSSVAARAGLPEAALPDRMTLWRQVMGRLSHPDFGVVHVPEGRQPSMPTREALRQVWPIARQLLAEQPLPAWAAIANHVAGQLLTNSLGQVDVQAGIRIVMEAAIAASKIDPRSIRQTLPRS